MFDFLSPIFTGGSFVPHGHCYLWQTGLVGLHVIADALIALAYYSISIALFYFVRQRQDLPFKWIFLLFAVFIISCGTTHLLEIWTLWHPTYWLSGGVKVITALISVFTAIELVPVIPQVLALPSPAELQRLNEKLQVSQASVSGILETASDAIISVNVNQQITLFNRAAEKIFGYTAAEAVGQSLDRLLPKRFVALHHQHVSTFNEQNGNTRRMGDRSEIFGRRKDGTEFPAEASISELEVAGEKIFTAFLRDVTDRKQAESALRLTDFSFESSSISAAWIRPDASIMRVNAAACQTLGYSREELQSMYVYDLDPNFPVELWSDHWQNLRQRKHLTFVTQQRTKDGRLLPVEVTLNYVEFNGEEYNFASMQDISDRLQAEAVLRESEERFRGAFDYSAIGMALISLDGHWLKVNPAVCEIVGYSREELFTLTFQDLTHPDDLKTDLSYVHQLMAGEIRTYQMEKRYFHRQGHIVWGLLNVSMVRNSQNEPLYFISQIQDITERKQAEETLRKTEQWLHQYSQQSPGNIYTLVQEPDGQTWFEYMSTAAETIYERTVEQILQDSSLIIDIIYPDDRLNYQDAVLESMQSLKPFSHQWRIITPSGQVKWLQGNSQPERRPNGAIAWHGIVQDITDRMGIEDERKRMEQALRESETRFRALVENAPDIIMRLDYDCRYLYINPTVERHSGVPADAFINKRIEEFGAPEALVELWRTNIQKTFETGQEQRLEFETSTDTVPVHYATRVVPEFANDGSVQSVLAIARDISDYVRLLQEREQAEEQLRQSEERLRLALKAARFGTWEHNFVTGELFQNDISDIYGLQPGQTHKNYEEWKAQIHPDDRDWLQTEFDRAIQTAGEFSYEFRIVRPDGTIRWSLSAGTVVHNQAGHPHYAYGIAADITDRKLAEVEQTAQQAFLRQVIDVVPNIIFVKDKVGRILIVNQAGATMHGTTVEAMLGKREIDFNPNFTVEQLEDFLAINRRVMQTRQSHTNLAESVVSASGETCWYQTVINPLIDVEGQVTGVIGATTDVTALKHAEQALQQAKEAAESASKAKSIFLANMSHEFRTPLNVILGFVQAMQRDPGLTLEQQEHLHIIHRSGGHLLSLINEVLDLSKIEAGHITLDESNVDLIDLLQSLEQMFRQRAAVKGLQLRLELAANLPQYVTIDANKLRQVLINLFSNAIKFTKQGQVTLRVQPVSQTPTQPNDRTGDRTDDRTDDRTSDSSLTLNRATIRFEVEDTGIGIHPTELETIFDAFVQTQAGKVAPDGTGLGLTISRKFVQMMGGKFTVQSIPGQGSTFAFTLAVPLARSADVAPEQPTRLDETLPSPLVTLYASDLSVMSSDWIAALRQAARLCDDNQIQQLTEQIPVEHAALIQGLRQLMQSYSFRQIVDLTSSGSTESASTDGYV